MGSRIISFVYIHAPDMIRLNKRRSLPNGVIYQYRLKAVAISVFTVMSLIAELSSIHATEFPDCQNQRLTIKAF